MSTADNAWALIKLYEGNPLGMFNIEYYTAHCPVYTVYCPIYLNNVKHV